MKALLERIKQVFTKTIRPIEINPEPDPDGFKNLPETVDWEQDEEYWQDCQDIEGIEQYEQHQQEKRTQQCVTTNTAEKLKT